MTNQEIFDLMDRFQRSTIQTMKLSMQDFSIELAKAAPAAAVPAAAAAAVAVSAASAAAPAPAEEDKNVITAPLVGTFYAASAPDKPPFVSAGDRVKEGQTVCLIEAMKMMSEIPAPCDCVITEVLKVNGDLAAFGEPLFRFQPC